MPANMPQTDGEDGKHHHAVAKEHSHIAPTGIQLDPVVLLDKVQLGDAGEDLPIIHDIDEAAWTTRSSNERLALGTPARSHQHKGESLCQEPIRVESCYNNVRELDGNCGLEAVSERSQPVHPDPSSRNVGAWQEEAREEAAGCHHGRDDRCDQLWG